MGKRKAGGMTGLSRFVAVLNQPESQQQSLTSTTSAPSETAALVNNPTTSGILGSVEGEGKGGEQSMPERGSSAKRARIESESVSVSPAKPTKHRYDATGLVPFYRNLSEVPEHLKKYFSQRTRLFSLYHTPPGCLLDEEGWYSVTPERIADQIAERCRCDTILDAFCGVGGNAIAFAKTCERVIALDTDSVRLALARHNAQIYGVADRIEFILADYISFAKTCRLSTSLSSPSPNGLRKIDVVFLSPPWGGPSYLSGTTGTSVAPAADDADGGVDADTHPTYSLASIRPVHGKELFDLTRRLTPNVAFYLPRNTDLTEIGDLLNGDYRLPEEQVEVEEEWMGSKLKALTCYFGGLAQGQENFF